MEKLVVPLLLYSCLAMNCVYGSIEPQNDVNKWLHGVLGVKGKIQEKVAYLKFYVQDVLGGPNATLVSVAHSPGSSKSATEFGMICVTDDLLTETPDLKSKPVGRVQGLVTSASKDEFALLLILNFVFTSGKFSGSSFALLGRNPVNNPLREMPILSGTGMFRLARGFVTTKTYQLTTPTQNGVYEYNAFVIHY